MPLESLPAGTVTFLFSDIEGSTRLWEEFPDIMRVALARHDGLMRQAIESAGGYVFKTIGDAFCAAFSNAPDGIAAAIQAQRLLHGESWPPETTIKVRMALHTGAVESRDNDYFGPPVNRVARLLSIAHGGQTVLSISTHELVRDALPPEITLRDMGEHRLKDLGRAEPVFQLNAPDLPSEFPPLRSLGNPELSNNLPQQVTSFVGRAKETAEIAALMEKSRLLTLIGIGGTGKTRLGLQAAADALDRFPDGAWYIELAPLTDPGLVGQAIATVLGVKEVAGQQIAQTLIEHLREKHLILVVDNCEHLLDAVAKLVSNIVQACPKVHILATSREALAITGEQAYRVPSLTLPDLSRRHTPESLAEFESVRLFVERAILARADFEVTPKNAQVLAQLCVQLDGIPFAIELAAARIRSMSVEEVNQRLDHRFGLLTGGSRTALPRQQTLRALIDWSYDLLSEQEKALLSRLSVFAGGWTLEPAEKICSGDPVEEWDILDLLTNLADKSLCQPEERLGTTRYRMLETVRQYAADRLKESGQVNQWRERHRLYFLGLAEEAEPNLATADQQKWLDRLDIEHDNMRAALDFSGQSEVAEEGLRLSASLGRFWIIRGHVAEGRKRYAEILKNSEGQPDSAMLAKSLHGAGNLAFIQSDYDEAKRYYARAATMRSNIGDRAGEAGSLGNLATIAQNEGDIDSARQQFERTLEIFQEVGNMNGVAISLGCLGSVAKDQGDLAAAKDYFIRATAINQEIGNRASEANSLNNLGVVLRDIGEDAAARESFERALTINRELGFSWEVALNLINIAASARDKDDFVASRTHLVEAVQTLQVLGARRHILNCLEEFAHLECCEGNYERAACLFGASIAQRESMSVTASPTEAGLESKALARIQSSLGAKDYQAALEAGSRLNLDQATELALG